MQRLTQGLTWSKRDVLVAILELNCENSDSHGVSTARLAERLQIRKPSVTHMLNIFQRWRLLERPKWGVSQLTPLGSGAAAVIRCRREFFCRLLTDTMKLPEPSALQNARFLESFLDDLTICAWADLSCLGVTLPPLSAEAQEPRRKGPHRSMAALPPGKEATIIGYKGGFRRYPDLSELGLLPGTSLMKPPEETLRHPLSYRGYPMPNVPEAPTPPPGDQPKVTILRHGVPFVLPPHLAEGLEVALGE